MKKNLNNVLLLKELNREDFSHSLRKNFTAFFLRAALELHGVTPSGFHVDVMTEIFGQSGSKKTFRRIILNAPPRHLKTFCVSISWPTWLLGINPRHNIIIAARSLSLCERIISEAERIIISKWYKYAFPGTILLRRENQGKRLVTSAGGFISTVPIMGKITGEGGDFLIVDDPQDPFRMRDPKYRKDIPEWLREVFFTRINSLKNGVIVLAMQRLHQWDAVYFLTRYLNRESWRIVSLPVFSRYEVCEIVGDKNFKRDAESYLNPAKFGLLEEKEIRALIGNSSYEAQYMQDPLPDEGFLSESWLKFISLAKIPSGYVRQSWDTASKTGIKNDFSVCTTWIEADNKHYLRSVFKDKLSYPELKKAVFSEAKKFSVDEIIVEDASSGAQLIQDLSGYLPIKSFISHSSKAERFSSIACNFEKGLVFFPENVSWLDDLIVELLSFPNCRHDDVVDTITQYFLFIRRKYCFIAPNITIL